MIRIITDSTCEAPQDVLTHASVTVVPLYVVFGQQSLKDQVEISREEFWRRLPTADPMPTTSQPTPADFLAPFRAFAEAGDEIVTITISSKLSGTYSSAIQAKAELPWHPIDVVDSLSTSVGLGLIVRRALRMAESGASRLEIVQAIEAMREYVPVLFSVDTLEYLARGGRIGKAQAFMGTLLSFKPMLGITDGVIVPVSRVRSRRKALDALTETHNQTLSARGPAVQIGVTHAGAIDEARSVAADLARVFETSDVFIADLGAVLGVHTGPGMIGAAVYAPDGN
jgi:DegV family protein with EDD domain